MVFHKSTCDMLFSLLIFSSSSIPDHFLVFFRFSLPPSSFCSHVSYFTVSVQLFYNFFPSLVVIPPPLTSPLTPLNLFHLNTVTNLNFFRTLVSGQHNRNLTQYNITVDDYDTYEFPEPWTDIDLSYPTEYDLEDDLAYLEEDDYEEEAEEEDLEEIELMEKEEEEKLSDVDETEELEDGSGILSLYDDDETNRLEEEEYYNALEELEEDNALTSIESDGKNSNSNMADDTMLNREVTDPVG